MFGQVFEELLGSQQQDGTALTASVTPTSILHPTGRIRIPAGYLYRVGQVLRIFAAGRVSNIVTTPGTLTLDLRMGALPPTIVVANGGAMALNTVAKTNVPWVLWWELTLRSVGITAPRAVAPSGRMDVRVGHRLPAPEAGGAGTHMLPNAAPALGTGFDSTVDNYLDLFATWSLNNANSIQSHQFKAWLSN
jgi:hypothetical protein